MAWFLNTSGVLTEEAHTYDGEGLFRAWRRPDGRFTVVPDNPYTVAIDSTRGNRRTMRVSHWGPAR